MKVRLRGDDPDERHADAVAEDATAASSESLTSQGNDLTDLLITDEEQRRCNLAAQVMILGDAYIKAVGDLIGAMERGSDLWSWGETLRRVAMSNEDALTLFREPIDRLADKVRKMVDDEEDNS